MDPEKFRNIREKLRLSRSELAEIFGLAGANVVANIETGFRRPGTTQILLLGLLDSLPEAEADALITKLREQARSYEEA